MLHTKFRGNRSTGSGEKKMFEGFLPYMVVAFDTDAAAKPLLALPMVHPP